MSQPFLLQDISNKRELERKMKKYEEKTSWIKNEMERLTQEKDINTYHTLQMNFSEVATSAAEIQMVQDYISMVETYS